MSETDYSQSGTNTRLNRTLMHVLYAMYTLAWASMGTLAVIGLIINYIKRSDEHDAVYASHHDYMIATFWWTVLLLILAAPLWLFFFFPGTVAYTIIGFWYLYRCLRGWLRFADGRFPF